ncbi:hypothetical protein FIBSPDRAFT_890379 [Athelia psychrophila]|uniref:Uncharacterized protein n=1 Tax=Athelia psychrophila TaxID=1759441 RepID=A0A166L268_9AGAM|nr:hypothetical protein FIBSPDRAFT_890379 [Fibularhizoctonia sp. CBS 109695]
MAGGRLYARADAVFVRGKRNQTQHTGEEWIKVSDRFGRWCWYRGVMAPADSKEVTVVADCSLFLTAESWHVCTGVNIGNYGDDGLEYSATSGVNGEVWFPANDNTQKRNENMRELDE